MVALTGFLPSLPLTMTGGTHGTGMAGGFFPWFGFPIMLLVVGLIAYLVYRTVQPTTQTASRTDHDSAVSLLRQRYASGEIDEEEFRTRKAQLES